MNAINMFLLAALLLGLTACKDADISQLQSLGSRHKVTLYACDGHAIQTWQATGNVSNEGNSDGWYFKDEQTGKLIEVTGTLVIEQQ
jgi:hypothetical protein